MQSIPFAVQPMSRRPDVRALPGVMTLPGVAALPGPVALPGAVAIGAAALFGAAALLGAVVVLTAVVLGVPASAQGGAPDGRATDPAAQSALDDLLDDVFGAGREGAPKAGRDLFDTTLSSARFLRRAVGPFDLHVLQADGLAKPKDAQRTLDAAAKGLQRAVPVMQRHFSRTTGGAVSGRRFPLILTSSVRARGEHAFDQVVALLDHCENGAFSDWKPANEVWTPSNLGAEVVRTWEVQVFNLAHPTIASQDKAWFEHGIGYYALAHVSNRLLRKGSWGLVPPWLGQGLIDELDIEAYGEAWVGGDTWVSQTPGWFRPGWSGFVPQGSRPPAPLTGPPADLGVTVQKTGNSWEQRASSSTRHWADLAADRKSAAPASFAFMARHESFLPRDRAYARCTLNLMLEIAPAQSAGLLDLLDREGRTPPSGMPDSDPLPALLSRALGGVPAVEELQALALQPMLERIGRPDLVDAFLKLDAAEALQISDHRAQAQWLYEQPRFDSATRGRIFNLILEAEHFEQMFAWERIGERLDAAAGSAFSASARYPKSDKDRAKVGTAFLTGTPKR